jgi:hypothetical protein
MTLARVKLPTFDVVPPNVIVAFPSVAVLLDKKLLGKVVATLEIVVFVSVTLPIELIVFPSETDELPIVTATFDNAIVPDVVIVPPDKPVPAVILVTVPLALPPPETIATVFNMITSHHQG